MFEASWSKEGGTTSFYTLFVITLLALTWDRGGSGLEDSFSFKSQI
jgi:hypothetical protein